MDIRRTSTVEMVEADVEWLNLNDVEALLRERWNTCNSIHIGEASDASGRSSDYWKGARSEAQYIADALGLSIPD